MSITINVTFNVSLNTSITTQTEEIPQALRIVTLIVCFVVITLGVIGNSLVLIVFCQKWSNLNSCEIFLINLAIADFLNATVAPVKTVLDLVHINLFSIGNDGCKIISFFGITSITVSAFTLLTVSIDRFIIVKWPLHKRPSLSTLLALVTLMWLVAGIVGCFYFVGENVKLGLHSKNVYSCFNYMKQNDFVVFSLAVFCIQCVIPIIIMTVIYMLVILELKKNAKSGIFAHCKNEMKLRLSQNKKVTKMIFLVVLVFYSCVLPSNSFYMWYLFSGQKHPFRMVKVIYDILLMLQMCNSVVNPIIYSRLHTSFKKDIRKVVFSCCFNNLEKWETFQDTVRSILHSGSSYRRRSSSFSLKSRTSIISLQHHISLSKRGSTFDDDSRRPSVETSFISDSCSKLYHNKEENKIPYYKCPLLSPNI
ncbi:neuropeptide Y receptor type 6 isoform X2 [Hydra vulgaris]|uniref:Neuropeptide Y receptor type 6 isoform X2 n=1 Tax=Hydra vulgaris TaxID=6087 RepID=A0ABM4BFA6_HYDVU